MPKLVSRQPFSQRIGLDRGRFKACVHYVCWRCEDPRTLDPARLTRVLWHADRARYLKAGLPLTGASYRKRQWGPAARALEPVIAELEREGAVATREHSYSGEGVQYFARHEPDLSAFAPDEISAVDAAVDAVCFRTVPAHAGARADDEVLRLAQIGELLPYHTVFSARPGEVTKRDMDWAAEHVRHGTGEANPNELAELAALNPRIDEVYAALEWHLDRDPSAGVQVPVHGTSFFVYKQRGHEPLQLPSITVVFTIDLGELSIRRMKFEFMNDEADEEAEDSAPGR